jgi:RTX calcium-binding nonapeptide repeat (4 copies)
MPTPAKSGPEFLINTTTASGQRDPAITTLADGRLLVVWQDNSGIGGDATGAGIKAQIYNADGTKSGSEFLINSTTLADQVEPTVTALDNGGFMVAWTDNSATGEDTTLSAIRARMFDAAGTAAAPDFVVNTITADNQRMPQIITLTGGNVVVVWQDDSNDSPFVNKAIRYQMYDGATGAVIGVETLVSDVGAGAQKEPGVAALADGGFVVTWTGDAPDDNIYFQRFNDQGVAQGTAAMVNAPSLLNQVESSVTGLSTGGFVVTWTDTEPAADGAGSAIRARVFDANGDPVTGEFVVNATASAAGDQILPVVKALTDGRFVVAWDDPSMATGDADGLAVRAQVFNSDGTKSGDEFVANTLTLNDQHDIAITLLADGRFMIGWQDESESVGDTNGDAVRGQIFDPRTAAVNPTLTDTANQYVGTVFGDTLSGLGGKDRLTGAGGADSVLGGTGDDHLSGNAGADTVLGGGGDDLIFGGAGRDSLNGNGGADDFVFATAAEARGDTIGGFTHLADDINLDAFMNNGRFIGARVFSDTRGEVRYVRETGLLQGDVNGDGRADWSMTIANKAQLTGADFLF